MAHKKLFIPGPTEVHPEVLKAMSQPMIGTGAPNTPLCRSV